MARTMFGPRPSLLSIWAGVSQGWYTSSSTYQLKSCQLIKGSDMSGPCRRTVLVLTRCTPCSMTCDIVPDASHIAPHASL